MSYSVPCFSRRIPFPVFPGTCSSVLMVLLMTGCGSGGTGTTLSGNTQVTVLATSTANDQLSSFTSTIDSLTLKTQSGTTVNLIASPVSEEFIHLNGHVEPIATVSIPQGTYVSASATYGGSYPVCNGQSPGTDMTDGLTGGPNGTVNLPNPITVDGKNMALLLNLNVDTYPEACPTPTEYVLAPPVQAAFELTPMTIAAQPANSANGLALGLEGIINFVGSGASEITVNGLVDSQTPPAWQVNLTGSTVLQGISAAAQLTAGMPVDMDLAIQPDGSLVATRVSVISTDTTTLTVASGPLMMVSNAIPVTFLIGTAQQGYLPATINGFFGYVNFNGAEFQAPDQFKNLSSLPFNATFTSANMVPGQNVTVTTQATLLVGGPTYSPLATMALRPQTINGTVSAISSAGGFTTYTVTLAAYDLFPQFAVQPGQTTVLTNPSSVTVYADSNTQMLNQNSLAVGSVVRFYGLVFNDSGNLRMDCAQINDGVAE